MAEDVPQDMAQDLAFGGPCGARPSSPRHHRCSHCLCAAGDMRRWGATGQLRLKGSKQIGLKEPRDPTQFSLNAALVPRRFASQNFGHVLEGERGELRHSWGRAESGGGGWVRFLFLWFSRSSCVFAFICNFARTRAGVALSRVGFPPASAVSMVYGKKASAIWSELCV